MSNEVGSPAGVRYPRNGHVGQPHVVPGYIPQRLRLDRLATRVRFRMLPHFVRLPQQVHRVPPSSLADMRTVLTEVQRTVSVTEAKSEAMQVQFDALEAQTNGWADTVMALADCTDLSMEVNERMVPQSVRFDQRAVVLEQQRSSSTGTSTPTLPAGSTAPGQRQPGSRALARRPLPPTCLPSHINKPEKRRADSLNRCYSTTFASADDAKQFVSFAGGRGLSWREALTDCSANQRAHRVRQDGPHGLRRKSRAPGQCSQAALNHVNIRKAWEPDVTQLNVIGHRGSLFTGTCDEAHALFKVDVDHLGRPNLARNRGGLEALSLKVKDPCPVIE
ncbi:unnamed protein product, partial [Prorocentrum cordatum]